MNLQKEVRRYLLGALTLLCSSLECRVMILLQV